MAIEYAHELNTGETAQLSKILAIAGYSHLEIVIKFKNGKWHIHAIDTQDNRDIKTEHCVQASIRAAAFGMMLIYLEACLQEASSSVRRTVRYVHGEIYFLRGQA